MSKKYPPNPERTLITPNSGIYDRYQAPSTSESISSTTTKTPGGGEEQREYPHPTWGQAQMRNTVNGNASDRLVDKPSNDVRSKILGKGKLAAGGAFKERDLGGGQSMK